MLEYPLLRAGTIVLLNLYIAGDKAVPPAIPIRVLLSLVIPSSSSTYPRGAERPPAIAPAFAADAMFFAFIPGINQPIGSPNKPAV